MNIYPAEIEAVLHSHPAVMDAGVFGIPNEEWGEQVHAIVQLKAGQHASAEELEDAVPRAPRRLQGAAQLRVPRPAPAHGVRQAAQAQAARRVLEGREAARLGDVVDGGTVGDRRR